LIDFVKKRFKVDYVDMITEPGPDKVLSEKKSIDAIDSIIRRVRISVKRHSSKIIVIAGHHDCLANPVNAAAHHRQIKKAVNVIKEWRLGADVFGIWVGEAGKIIVL